MKNSKVNLPVLIIFFNRPDKLSKVFSLIKEARPSILFLAQDGPRKGNVNDIEQIKLCRNIVDEIDWDCKVYKNYSEDNLSCDPKEFSSISWAFNYVDRLVILEDDCLPNISFFDFCYELLEKFKNDQRVHMVSGMNKLGIYEESYHDYIFSNVGSGWGWATWKRVWIEVERNSNFEFLHNQKIRSLIKEYVKTMTYKGYRDILKAGDTFERKTHQLSRIISWEYLLGVTMLLNSSYVITPKKNLISNIGVGMNSTHSVNDIRKLPKEKQKLFFMETHKLDLPIKHPEYLLVDFKYERIHNFYFNPSNFKRMLMKFESIFRRFIMLFFKE